MLFASNLDTLLEQKLSHVVPLMEPYPQTLPMMMSNAMELKVHLKAASISMFMTVEALRVQVLSAREMSQLLQVLFTSIFYLLCKRVLHCFSQLTVWIFGKRILSQNEIATSLFILDKINIFC